MPIAAQTKSKPSVQALPSCGLASPRLVCPRSTVRALHGQLETVPPWSLKMLVSFGITSKSLGRSIPVQFSIQPPSDIGQMTCRGRSMASLNGRIKRFSRSNGQQPVLNMRFSDMACPLPPCSLDWVKGLQQALWFRPIGIA
jgi:hypothetical protein